MTYKTFVTIILFFSFGISSYSQELAFPTAEGAGKYVSGGRGGKVIFVTNLNDSGKGSLRAAIKDTNTRIIIFRISGTIYLQSQLEIKHGNLTIAGQTAPGDGICVAGNTVNIETNNVIVRYMRFRLGDINKVTGDAFSGQRCKNIMIDHCSMSWATDENASFYRNSNFTLQWCIISESLNSSVHFKGEHGYGGIWGGNNATFHHNLIMHNSSRNPRFNGNRGFTDELVDFRNNVIYNWGINSIYGGENGGKYNIVANYFKSGPATHKRCRNRIVNITTSENYDYGTFYVAENKVDGNNNISEDNWNGGVDTEAEIQKVKTDKPFDHVEIKQQTADDAFSGVLKYAGASLYRDSIDIRLVNEAKTGTARYGATFMGGGKGIIDSQNDVGGWPVLKSLPAPEDSDMDGMPDSWEKENKLEVNNPLDNSAYQLNAAYTNLEVYLESLTVKTCTSK
jgi:hypothetical protein